MSYSTALHVPVEELDLESLRNDTHYLFTGARRDYDMALDRARASAQHVLPNHPDWAAYQEILAMRLGDDCFKTGSLVTLDQAIKYARQAMQKASDTLRPSCENTLGRLLGYRGARRADVDDVREAIKLLETAIAASHPNAPETASYMNCLAVQFHSLYKQTLKIEHIEKAIRLSRQAVHETSKTRSPSLWGEYVANLAFHLWLEALRSRTCDFDAKLKEALGLIRSAIDATPKGHSIHARHSLVISRILSLGNFFLIEGFTLKDALESAQHSLDQTPQDDYEYCHCLYHLAMTRSEFFEHSGRLERLENLQVVIQLLRDAVSRTSQDSLRRYDYLSQLSAHLCQLGRETRDLKAFDDAIDISRTIVQDYPGGSSELNKFRRAHQNNLHEKFKETREEVLIDEAILHTRKAQESTPKDDILYEVLQLDLAMLIREKGGLWTLFKTRVLGANVSKTLPKNGEHLGFSLYQQAIEVSERYYRRGNTKHLHEAIEKAQQARDTGFRRQYLQQECLNLISNCYMELFEYTQDEDYLKCSLENGRLALEGVPENYPGRLNYLADLAFPLMDRYDRTRALPDLEEAINVARQACEMSPAVNRNAKVFLVLSMTLARRYERTHNEEDLATALSSITGCVNRAPKNDPQFSGLLHQQGLVLCLQYRSTGKITELDKAIHCLRRCQVSPRFRADLAKALYWRYKSQRQTSDLQEAIELTEQALKRTPEKDPDTLEYLDLLGDLFVSQTPEKAKAHQNALRKYSNALHVNTASVVRRVEVAKKLLSDTGSPQHKGVLDDVILSMDLLQKLVPYILRAADMQNILMTAAGLTSDAVAIAVIADQSPSTIIGWLEAGRNMLAGTLRDLRTDISELVNRHPSLALELRKHRDRLEAPLPSSHGLHPSPTGQKLDTDQREQASRRLDETISKIRKQKGFERFLKSPEESELLSAARDGPIVIINISIHRCNYIIVKDSGISIGDLPDVTVEQIRSHRKSLGDPTTESLKWLWYAIVKPVLQALGFKSKVPSNPQSRLWWIPTGPLVGFPLHAAGDYDLGPGQNALDQVISSYTISITALMLARQKRQDTARNWETLLVEMPYTIGIGKLDFVTNEISLVQSATSLLGKTNVLKEPDKKQVLHSLKSCDIFHFAGHGNSNPSEPLKSHLCLADWTKDPFTVENLLSMNMSESIPFLAYLSACGSSQNIHEDSVDENIHLTASCQLAGFRHAIGTLWTVKDSICGELARLFYVTLLQRGASDEAVSLALHTAIKRLRDEELFSMNQDGTGSGARDVQRRESRRSDKKFFWVPYIHFGP